jgi:type IV pilus assembly protein PilW
VGTIERNKEEKLNKAGFTLVELLITVVISGLIMAAVYSGYSINQKVYNNEQNIVEMQQNIRVAMAFMVNDIRMAGYDPTGNAGATICNATQGWFSFTQDLDELNGVPTCAGVVTPGQNPGEYVAYGFSNAVGGDDIDRDGIPDAGGATELRRELNTGGYWEVASGIAAIEFNYIMEDGSTSLAPTNLDEIVKVQVTILAQSGIVDQKFNNTMVYTTGSGASWGPFDDNIRRRMLTTTIHCRNMGI